MELPALPISPNAVREEYTLSLILQDPIGASQSVSQTIIAENRPPDIQSVSWNDTAPLPGDTPTLTAVGTDIENQPLSWGLRWVGRGMDYSATLEGNQVSTGLHIPLEV